MSTKNDAAAETKGFKLTVTRIINAPREMVWRACTEAKQMAQWWGPRGFTAPVCEWDAKPDNKIYVVMRAPDGTDFPMGGKFHEVVAAEKLVTTTGALDDKGNLIFEFHHTLTLAESPNGKTKLTMHSRLTSIFNPEAAKYVGGFEAGMTQSLERLEELLVTKGEPLIVERVFNAPVASVWRALTDKNEISRWSFEMKEFKPEVGFEFEFHGEKDDVKYLHHCKIIEVIPQKRLAYSWRYEGYAGDSLVTFELFAEGNKTHLKLTHEGLDSFPKIPGFARKNFVEGWTQIIGANLKRFVEPK